MIAGYVNEYYEAIIPIRMRGNIPSLDAVIDTGFQGADLLLPRAVINLLGLRPAGDMILLMADEREARFTYYNGEVLWHYGFKRVRVLESENSYLASADLLAGSHIEIDMIPGGIVRIEALTAHGEPVEP